MRLAELHTLFNIIYIMRIYCEKGESGLSADKCLQWDIQLFVQRPDHL